MSNQLSFSFRSNIIYNSSSNAAISRYSSSRRNLEMVRLSSAGESVAAQGQRSSMSGSWEITCFDPPEMGGAQRCTVKIKEDSDLSSRWSWKKHGNEEKWYWKKKGGKLVLKDKRYEGQDLAIFQGDRLRIEGGLQLHGPGDVEELIAVVIAVQRSLRNDKADDEIADHVLEAVFG